MHFTSVSYITWMVTVKHMKTWWDEEFCRCFLDRASGSSPSQGGAWAGIAPQGTLCSGGCGLSPRCLLWQGQVAKEPGVPFGDWLVVMPRCLLRRGRMDLSNYSTQLSCSIYFVIFEGQLPGLLCKWSLSLLAWWALLESFLICSSVPLQNQGSCSYHQALLGSWSQVGGFDESPGSPGWCSHAREVLLGPCSCGA